MIRSYFVIAFRNLWRQKGLSFLNITGLAIGMTAGFLVLLYVHFELSYDKFHSKADRIYRVVTDIETPNETLKFPMPTLAVPQNLKKQFPEIEAAVRIYETDMLVRNGEANYRETNTIAADSAFFSVFDFKLVQGNQKNALKNPFSIVLSKSAAHKYFGNENPMGKSLKIFDEGHFTKVTGVMEDIPENSHIQADMILSMTTFTAALKKDWDNQWGLYEAFAYLLLKPKANPDELQSKFPEFLRPINGETLKGDTSQFFTLLLEPFESVYLHSKRGYTISGNMNNIYIFSIIAIFILFIACVNFINLTTARSVERAKEVGVRKVIGAGKFQLVFQFIGESIILCFLAFIVALALTTFLLPYFNDLVGKTISTSIFSSSFHIPILAAISLGIGLLAGCYPAFVLSSFKSVSVLKNNFSTGGTGVLFRKGLVIVQFTISIALIIGTIIIYDQLNFMHNKELGFDKEQLLIVETNGPSSKTTLKSALDGVAGVQSTSLISTVPGKPGSYVYSEIEDVNGDFQIMNIPFAFVDFDYIPQFGLQVIAGRPFSRHFATDSTQAMVINVEAAKSLGYPSPEKAIGAEFQQWGRKGKIIGVVEDFHFSSLQKEIQPLTMRIEPDKSNLIAVKLLSGNMRQTMDSLSEEWQRLYPGEPFSYYFLDEFFNRQYQTEERFMSLFVNFAILAIIISCLGLFALAAYSTLQRKREIGIRKVLGASVSGVVNLLSMEYMKLVGIAFIVASPIAWFAMEYWLEDFAYKISIQWWMFALAGIATLFIALLTVSFHAIKASLMNPVKSLRTE